MRSDFLYRQRPAILSVLILAAAVFLTMKLNAPVEPLASDSEPSAVSSAVSSQPEEAEPVSVQPQKDEMRAVWVPYMSLSMSGEKDQSEKGFQKKFDAIVSGAKAKGLNTLIVQVRPFGDALYPSQYFPWSHIMTGTQGVNPGYDPLDYMVKSAHKSGLEIHAWVNPLRIQSKSTPSIISHNNPYSVWKEDGDKKGWTVDLSDGKYYNPAYPGVRKLVVDGVKEIVEKYDVDGIQFDDYFYPTEDPSFDTGSYQAYQASAGGGALGLMDWRRANINALVSQVYAAVKESNPKVLFGISPQANIQNDLKMGADVTSWCSVKGYVDYICPQLYVNFDHPVLPFDTGAQQWKALVTDPEIKLYFGLALYKAGSDVDDGTWKKSSDILEKQVEAGRKLGCDGFMFYSWDYFNADQTKEEVANVVRILNNAS